MSMIEPEFTFFQMQLESVFDNAVELRQPPFGKAPEGFDSIDVMFPPWRIRSYRG